MPISLQELSLLLKAYLPEWYSTKGNIVSKRYLVTSEQISGSTFEGKGWMVLTRDLGAMTTPHNRELTCQDVTSTSKSKLLAYNRMLGVIDSRTRLYRTGTKILSYVT